MCCPAALLKQSGTCSQILPEFKEDTGRRSRENTGSLLKDDDLLLPA